MDPGTSGNLSALISPRSDDTQDPAYARDNLFNRNHSIRLPHPDKRIPPETLRGTGSARDTSGLGTAGCRSATPGSRIAQEVLRLVGCSVGRSLNDITAGQARLSVRMEQGGTNPCRPWSKPSGSNPRRWARPGRDRIEPLVPFLCSTLHDCSSQANRTVVTSCMVGNLLSPRGRSHCSARWTSRSGGAALPSRLPVSPLLNTGRTPNPAALDHCVGMGQGVRCCSRHRSTIDRRTAAQGFLPAPGICE